MKVEITNGTLDQKEIDAYIAHAEAKYPDREIKTLGIDLDGDYVNLRYELAAEPFQRIRRITGYLVGDMRHWNNAKRAEEHDRVTHQA
ncbi:MAG: anaerobic ribonucleoside-triphosphate reductase [Bacillota bacterium]|nr:anaerobic ribonucleoside-triphosphate reductase [Bacillota bacterium]